MNTVIMPLLQGRLSVGGPLEADVWCDVQYVVMFNIHCHPCCRDGYVRVVRSKLMYRVVFPFELKLGSTSAEDGLDGADAAYQLFAIIVHVGSGLDHGEACLESLSNFNLACMLKMGKQCRAVGMDLQYIQMATGFECYNKDGGGSSTYMAAHKPLMHPDASLSGRRLADAK